MNQKREKELNAIDTRLEQLEAEKKALLARRNELQAEGEPHQEPQALNTQAKVALFKQLFRGQEDVYATRWENNAGRSGYAIACHNDWKPGICGKPAVKCSKCPNKAFKSFDNQAIYNHLAGTETIGVYPLLRDNQCWLLAVDFDKADWQDAVRAFGKVCQQTNIPYAIERSRSGNGAHLWIFFSEKVPAQIARKLGFSLLDRAMEIHAKLSFDSYDRLFPNQDTMPAGGFGNLIALPLQQHPRQHGNSVFIDDNFIAYKDQWAYLANVKRMSLAEVNEQVNAFVGESDNQGMKYHDVKNNAHDNAAIKPWEQGLPIQHTKIDGCPKKVTLILANQIYIPLSPIPAALVTRLKRLASFANPVFFKTQAMRFSTHGIPRYISCAQIDKNYLCLPRGCLDDTLALLSEQSIQIQVDDKRHQGARLFKLKFQGNLRNDQQRAVTKLTTHDFGVLHAPTAFGKTVTAIGVICQRKVSTLILVHSRQLLDQWKERLSVFLEGAQIGTIGGGKRKASGEIDIATYQSLINSKNNEIDPQILEYGQVIVDECHHVSAPRFELLLNEVRAKYVLGVTATPDRQDGHQRIIFMQAGPIRHKVEEQKSQFFDQRVVIKQLFNTPPLELTIIEKPPHISDVYQWLVNCKDRNQVIIDDILNAIDQHRNPLVLTERRDHAMVLGEMLSNKGIRVQVLRGAMPAKERKAAVENLEQSQVILATGKYLGEGFDLPKLDTLFLALPISWKGTLAQYAGRIHRRVDTKKEVIIHDYVDTSLPMLQRMFERRAKGYKAMGYEMDNGTQSMLSY